MFFCAEAVTNVQSEFDEACACFAKSVRPGGTLVAAFLVNSASYELDGVRSPIMTLSEGFPSGHIQEGRRERRDPPDRNREGGGAERLHRHGFADRCGDVRGGERLNRAGVIRRRRTFGLQCSPCRERPVGTLGREKQCASRRIFVALRNRIR